MLVSCNGIRVLSGEIYMPRIGTWIADLSLDGEPPTGACTISVADGAVTFTGTVVRGGSFRERHAVMVVGGAGGLSTYVVHRHHRAVPVEMPLRAILADAGETLSTTSDTATLGARLSAWSRRAGTAGDAIGTLMEDVGASWRVLDDGSVWVGTETWPTLATPVQVLGSGPTADSAEVATDLPVIRPGMTVDGRRVSSVTHRFDPAKVRSHVLYERAGTADRLKAALFGMARSALAAVDYHPSYAATVVRQQGNGDLEVRIDDERFRRTTTSGTGIAGVKRWPGIPGLSYAIGKGARVLVGFLDGRGEVPIVTGWNSGTPESVTLEADRINLGADAEEGRPAETRGVARLSDTADTCTVSVSQLVPPSGGVPGIIAITFTPAFGPPFSIELSGTALTATPATGTITSVISSASSKVFAE